MALCMHVFLTLIVVAGFCMTQVSADNLGPYPDPCPSGSTNSYIPSPKKRSTARMSIGLPYVDADVTGVQTNFKTFQVFYSTASIYGLDWKPVEPRIMYGNASGIGAVQWFRKITRVRHLKIVPIEWSGVFHFRHSAWYCPAPTDPCPSGSKIWQPPRPLPHHSLRTEKQSEIWLNVNADVTGVQADGSPTDTREGLHFIIDEMTFQTLYSIYGRQDDDFMIVDPEVMFVSDKVQWFRNITRVRHLKFLPMSMTGWSFSVYYCPPTPRLALTPVEDGEWWE